jgi:hypothetical protein
MFISAWWQSKTHKPSECPFKGVEYDVAIKKNELGLACSPVVELLSSMCKALNSLLRTCACTHAHKDNEE